MKIAVEISGHLRTFAVCAPLLRRYLLDRYDCDVFIHTWDKMEHQNLSWHGKKGMGDGKAAAAVDEAITQKVMDLYQPKKIIFENEADIKKIDGFLIPPRARDKDGDDFGGFALQAVYNTLYTEVRAHQLMTNYAKENNIKYDFVIRTRPDIGLLEPFVIDPYLPFFNMHAHSVVFFPSWIYTLNAFSRLENKDYEKFLPGSMDVFYLTTPDAMDGLMTIIEAEHFHHSFIHTPRCFPSRDWQIRWSVELLFLWHAQKMGVLHHFGKINRIIKRNDPQHDVVVVHQDRIENSKEHLVIKPKEQMGAAS